MMPFFSIIIPMYNRERFIGRAIASCLAQDFDDFEIIVVDDASTDDSVARVRACSDPRIRLVYHDVNRGPSPARNTALMAARAEWCVFLDSDDELLPGALTAISKRAREASQQVSGLRFMCRDDHGRLSPEPGLEPVVWGYTDYLDWLEFMRGRASETLPCARRSSFPDVAYPDDRSLETLYHLDLARAGSIMSCPEVVRLYHYDAADRITGPGTRWTLRAARDQAASMEKILATHGPALAAHAPGVLQDTLRAAALYSFLAGQRREGLGYALQLLRAAPGTARIYGIMCMGMIGPRSLAWARGLRSRDAAHRSRARALTQAT